MEAQELKDIAIRFIRRGCPVHEVRYFDDMYTASAEELDIVKNYMEWIIDAGIAAFKSNNALSESIASEEENRPG